MRHPTDMPGHGRPTRLAAKGRARRPAAWCSRHTGEPWLRGEFQDFYKVAIYQTNKLDYLLVRCRWPKGWPVGSGQNLVAASAERCEPPNRPPPGSAVMQRI